MKTPLYKELSNEALVTEYVGLKSLAYTGAAVKSRNLGKILRNLDIVIAIARKRGVALPA